MAANFALIIIGNPATCDDHLVDNDSSQLSKGNTAKHLTLLFERKKSWSRPAQRYY
jgi:hypothetical protein